MTVELAEGSTYYFIDPVLTNCALGHKAQVHDKRGNIWAGEGGGGTGHVRGATGHVRGGGEGHRSCWGGILVHIHTMCMYMYMVCLSAVTLKRNLSNPPNLLAHVFVQGIW